MRNLLQKREVHPDGLNTASNVLKTKSGIDTSDSNMKPYHRVLRNNPGNQKEWARENLKPSEITTCNRCGKYISKHWHKDPAEWPLAQCGNCYFRIHR